MWVLRKTSASGVSLRRRISLLATLLVVAFFAICGPLVRTAYADGDASWKGDTLQYDGHDFTSTSDAPTYKGMSTEYQWIDTSQDPNSAYVFYFKDSNAQQATSAQLLIYTYNPPANYTAPSEASTVKISTGDASTGSSSDAASSCSSEYFGGVGWIVCSVSSWISKGVDGMYTLISNFLEVDTISQGNNGVYAMWDMARSVANICFIIVFLVIVYSQLTSVGYSNYNIKDMIPRLVIAAIVVNISFWICALFVDVSNVLGYSIDSLFNGIRDKLNLTVDVNWTDITTLILSGGTATVGTLAFAAAAAGSWAALGFIILGTLVSAGMSLLAAFVILAVRQALIVVLVIIAPLAFVAMVLPSTKGLFHKWRKSLTMLLVFFPIFALLFGGSQLAGIAIINSQYHIPGGGHIEIVLIGLAVQVIPLAVTPMIMQFADGLLGRIAGIANNKQRGIADRARNWTKDNADYHTARKKNKVDADIAAGRNRGLRAHGIGRLGLAMDQGARKRKASMGDIDKSLENRMEARRQERIRTQAGNYGRTMYETALRSHENHERAELHKNAVEAAGNEHWAHTLDHDSNLKAVRRQTAKANRRAEVITKDLDAKDKRSVESMVNRDPALRARAVSAIVAENEAQAHIDSVAVTAEENWKNRQNNNGYLRVMRTQTDHAKKRAAQVEDNMSATDQQAYNDLVDLAATPVYRRIRDLRQQTHIAQKGAEAIDARMTAADQRVFDEAVNQSASPVYARIRDAKVQTSVDTSHSKLAQDQIESEARRDFNQEFVGSAPSAKALRRQRYDTIENNKTADLVESRDKAEGEARFERISSNGSRPDLKSLRIQDAAASGSLKEAQANWQKIISDVQNKGVNSGYITQAADMTAAGRLQQDARTVVAAENAAKVIQSATQGVAEQAYIESQEGQLLATRAQAAQDALDTAKAEETARMSELRTDAGAKVQTGEMAVLAEEMGLSYIQKRAQEQRAANASSVANLEYAGKVLKEEIMPGTAERIMDIAGGVSGEAGASQAQATAKKTVFDDIGKGIAAEKTLLSQIPEKDILEQLNDDDILDRSIEHIAALGGTIASRRHMTSHIKLWRRMGELGAQAQDELRIATENRDQDAIQKAKDKLGKVKDLQQQVMSDKSKVPFGVGDSDMGAATVGQYTENIYDQTRKRVSTHMSAKKLAEMDPDDMRLLFEMARAGKFNEDELSKIRKAYDDWGTDPILSPSLDDRHRRLLDPIESGIYPTSADDKFWDSYYDL